MLKKLLFGAIWLGLTVYAFGFAPPDRPETFALIVRLSTGQWEGINPWIISLFNAMGIWPLLYCGLMLVDGDGQRLKAWPFAAASMAVGAFAILPYLALRTPHQDWFGQKDWGLKLWNSRWIGAIGLAGAVACFSFGLSQGDWADFVRQWQSSRFINVMSLDFCLLSLLFPALVSDDLVRRQERPALLWVTVLPLLGPSLYLILRKPLTLLPPVHSKSATINS